MEIYFAGHGPAEKFFVGEEITPPYLLGSFYYMEGDDWTSGGEGFKLGVKERAGCKGFLLDSGAFTFMEKTDSEPDFGAYLDDYIDCINRHDIENFFELDIDSVVGLHRVRELRDRLERETGKECIPVWHRSRGRDAFLRLCQDYDHIAIGGIVSGEITRSDYKYLPKLIEIAHDHDTHIHGLGFTPTKDMSKYRFDSVDSRSWMSGGAFGTIYEFTGSTLEQNAREERVADYMEADRHNLRQWLKFARYMDGRHGTLASQ